MLRPVSWPTLLLLAALVAVSNGCAPEGETTTAASSTGPASADLAPFDSLDATLRRTRARFERLLPPTSEEENALRRPRTPRYAAHLEAAAAFGVEPVEGEAAIRQHLASGALVPLGETEFYTVRILEHSAPFVTPALKAQLDELGRRFRDELDARGLPRYRFTISSGLRTAELQADLRQSNRNAASGASSHEYGVSVDIVNFRYAYSPRPEDYLNLDDAPMVGRLNAVLEETYRAYGGLYWDHLFGIMTRLLREMQRDGDLFVLLEAEQPVFHITIRR
ncbi:MAG: hypothetical protein HKN04_06835 [Rhodothermaceae bacterium]|nr:hypothetical protein [Rhodothermaceae bacterium]